LKSVPFLPSFRGAAGVVLFRCGTLAYESALLQKEPHTLLSAFPSFMESTRRGRWTKTFPLRAKRLWANLGPGIVTGASDDDPSGIATYSQAGAAFGLATLWTALLTFPLMAAMQEMCARIGLVTQRGLAGTLRQHYPRWVLYGLLVFTFPAIVLNIGADLEGMGAVAHMLLPQVPTFAYSIAFTGVLLAAIIVYPEVV